jgi:hypothetical protein
MPWLGLMACVVLLVFAMKAVAQAPAAPAGAAPQLSAEELNKLVGPIALYPDDLVGIILPASTNPLQLVQADRYLDKRKADPKLPIDDKWDDSVKSLLNYPDIVKTMSADLDWTSALGEAVVSDSGAVLDAVQVFRRQAQATGNLKSDAKQVVVVEKEIITIAPADPQVIYVPQYNPSTVVVYGAPAWGYYPTPYPSYYYPYAPGAALAAGVVWGAAIGAAWSGNHYGAHYGGDANINVNRNTNINTGNINTGNVNRGGGAGQQAGGGTAWKSSKQPGQVSSSVGKTASSTRAGDARAGGGGGYGSGGGAAARPSTQAAGGGAAGRQSTQGAGAAGGGAASRNQPGTISASPRDSYGGSGGRGGGSGGDAFGGYGSGSGRQTQMDSSRGASSRSASSGASARSMPSGGGGRGGGGGGGRGGGGRR